VSENIAKSFRGATFLTRTVDCMLALRIRQTVYELPLHYISVHRLTRSFCEESLTVTTLRYI